jgi:hypothetical protein
MRRHQQTAHRLVLSVLEANGTFQRFKLCSHFYAAVENLIGAKNFLKIGCGRLRCGYYIGGLICPAILVI